MIYTILKNEKHRHIKFMENKSKFLYADLKPSFDVERIRFREDPNNRSTNAALISLLKYSINLTNATSPIIFLTHLLNSSKILNPDNNKEFITKLVNKNNLKLNDIFNIIVDSNYLYINSESDNTFDFLNLSEFCMHLFYKGNHHRIYTYNGISLIYKTDGNFEVLFYLANIKGKLTYFLNVDFIVTSLNGVIIKPIRKNSKTPINELVSKVNDGIYDRLNDANNFYIVVDSLYNSTAIGLFYVTLLLLSKEFGFDIIFKKSRTITNILDKHITDYSKLELSNGLHIK